MSQIRDKCNALGLEPLPSDEVVMLAPLPEFWELFRKSVFFDDGLPDPLDRYSKFVIEPLAMELGVEAVFPSDGPPYPPFIAWAMKAEGVYVSPIGLLVHDRFGLFVSFRGALKMENEKAKTQNPCMECERPCVCACPVDAFSGGEYNVEACRAHLKSGNVECWQGCMARRVCPVVKIPRNEAQSNFHMRAFVV